MRGRGGNRHRQGNLQGMPSSVPKFWHRNCHFPWRSSRIDPVNRSIRGMSIGGVPSATRLTLMPRNPGCSIQFWNLVSPGYPYIERAGGSVGAVVLALRAREAGRKQFCDSFTRQRRARIGPLRANAKVQSKPQFPGWFSAQICPRYLQQRGQFPGRNPNSDRFAFVHSA